MKVDIYIRQADVEALDAFKASGGNVSALFSDALNGRLGSRAEDAARIHELEEEVLAWRALEEQRKAHARDKVRRWREKRRES
jgi:phosphate uptake regulator